MQVNALFYFTETDMNNPIQVTLEFLSTTFRSIENLVPSPVLEQRDGTSLYICKERMLEQVVVLKLARYITGLRAINILCQQGFFTEQGVIQRTLDEISEDIDFLAVARAAGGAGDLQEKFMDAFFDAELPDPRNPKKRIAKPAMVPRRKIRAWMNSQSTAPLNPSDLNNLAENSSTAYSKYIHASANTCLELYQGNPPRLHTEGLKGTHFTAVYETDAKNYFYRGLIAIGTVAIVLGADRLYADITDFQDMFVDATGVGVKSRRISGEPPSGNL